MYKLFRSQITNEIIGILKSNLDGSITSFGLNEENTDYQEYLEWLAEGNEVLPADEPTAE